MILSLFSISKTSHHSPSVLSPWLVDYVKAAQSPDTRRVFTEECVLMRMYSNRLRQRRQTTPGNSRHQQCQTGRKIVKRRRFTRQNYSFFRASDSTSFVRFNTSTQPFSSAVVSAVAMATQSTHDGRLRKFNHQETKSTKRNISSRRRRSFTRLILRWLQGRTGCVVVLIVTPHWKNCSGAGCLLYSLAFICRRRFLVPLCYLKAFCSQWWSQTFRQSWGFCPPRQMNQAFLVESN